MGRVGGRNFHQQVIKSRHVTDSTCKEVNWKQKTELRTPSHFVFGKAQFGRKLMTSPDQLGRTLSQAPGTFRAFSEGPGTFRKQRQTTENDTKIIKIMNIVGNGSIWLGLG